MALRVKVKGTFQKGNGLGLGCDIFAFWKLIWGNVSDVPIFMVANQLLDLNYW